jgi:hypothetical protein
MGADMERSKYDFPAVRRFAAIAVVLVMAGRTSAQVSGHDVADGLKLNVVKIEAAFSDHTENGFGFIVGERTGALYIATANHVVFPQDGADLTPAKVKVQFYDYQGTSIDATLLGTHDVPHDLAVLTVVPPQGFNWQKHCLGRTSDHQKLGTEVWYVGKTGGWNVPVSPGHIANEEIIDGLLNVETLSILPGSSGGPLVAPSGIVGLILRDDAANATALSITYVKTLFKNWNHPWNVDLADTAAPPPAVAQTQPASPPPVVPAAAVIPVHEGWYELYTRNSEAVRPGILLHLRRVSDDYFLAESSFTTADRGWLGELRRSGNAWNLKVGDFRGMTRIPNEGSALNPGSGNNEVSKEGPLVTFKNELATFVWKETDTRPGPAPQQTAAAAPPQPSAGAQLFGALVGGLISAQTTRTPSDRCQSGYAWREARQNDHVCVTEETRQRTAMENADAPVHLDASGRDCQNGYVRREAVYGDRVCVVPRSRDQAAYDNQYAGSRIAR